MVEAAKVGDFELTAETLNGRPGILN